MGKRRRVALSHILSLCQLLVGGSWERPDKGQALRKHVAKGLFSALTHYGFNITDK